MRTVTYGAACSLDGFITAADGAIDWLHSSRDVQDVMTKYWATIDTVLMGRKTWEVAMAMSGGGAARKKRKTNGGAKKESKGPVTYVFSRTLGDISDSGAL